MNPENLGNAFDVQIDHKVLAAISAGVNTHIASWFQIALPAPLKPGRNSLSKVKQNGQFVYCNHSQWCKVEVKRVRPE